MKLIISGNHVKLPCIKLPNTFVLFMFINAQIIAIIWAVVFTLPYQLAAITFASFCTAINLYPETMNSLIITIIGIHAGSISLSTKISIAVNTNILSAIGSKNFPKSVTKLFFLAIFPSKLSVIDATIKIIFNIHIFRLIFKKELFIGM